MRTEVDEKRKANKAVSGLGSVIRDDEPPMKTAIKGEFVIGVDVAADDDVTGYAVSINGKHVGHGSTPDEAMQDAIAERMAKISVAAGRHVRSAVMMSVAQDIADALNRAKVGPSGFRKRRLLAGPSLRALQ